MAKKLHSNLVRLLARLDAELVAPMRSEPGLGYAKDLLLDAADFARTWSPVLAQRADELRSELHPSRLAETLKQHVKPEIAAHSFVPELVDATPGTATVPSVDVVVCVHDALDDVRSCLGALERSSLSPERLILIDDGSGRETQRFLEEFSQREGVVLERRDEANGYTCAANRGLARARAEAVLLLNSDAVLSHHALERLVQLLGTAEHVAAVGPMSNAASWQSTPDLLTASGDWFVNALPAEASPETMEADLASCAAAAGTTVPLLNGFCLLLRRSAIEKVGMLDEAAFPRGYGEENDLCIRLRDAGYGLAVCLDAYVFHAKSRSYSHARRRKLADAGHRALVQKHGRSRVARDVAAMTAHPHLRAHRETHARLLPLTERRASGFLNLRVDYLLPVRGGGGGAHSVVQEVCGLRCRGVEARVLVPSRFRSSYRRDYPGLPPEAFVGLDDATSLRELSRASDALIATTFDSVARVRECIAHHVHIAPLYYVQDHEPDFFPNSDPRHQQAAMSYNAIPNAALFAKTEWLCSLLRKRYGADATRVAPSLDRGVYHPGPSARVGEPIAIAAMVRTATSRRAPEFTMRVLGDLVQRQGARVEIHLFGDTRLHMRRAHLDRHFSHIHHGKLRREQVADLLRRCQLFVDLSTYQAFGRTGLEAMACGCVPIVPQSGGTSEYLEHGVNGWQVDTSEDAACAEALDVAISANLKPIRTHALATAARYSIAQAAEIQHTLIAERVTRHRRRLALDASRHRA